MPNVPISSREVAPSVEATPYKKVNLNGDMFGQNVYEAAQKLNNAGFDFREKMIEIKNRIDDTKLMEAKNLSSKWVQDNLMDKENGYFYKTGKDAYGKSEGLLNDYDKVMNDFIEKANLTPRNKELAKMSLDKIREPIMNQMYSHDYKSGVEWSNNVANDTLNNYLTDAVNSRNDPEMINNSIANGLKIIEWQGSLQHLDDEAINALKKNYVQNLLGNVLNTKLGEGSLDASEFFEKYKNDLDPQKLPNFVARVKDNELNYTARETAQYLMTLPVEQANNEIEKIQDYQTREAVEREYNKKYRERENLKSKAENEALDRFYDTVLAKQQNGETLTYEDIPDNLDSKTKLSMMKYINSNGSPTDDDETWEELYNKSVNDAQGFAKLNLNKYRGELSESEYKTFVKKQEEIKSGKYYSVIKDDDKKINEALKILGLEKGKKKNVAYSEIRTLVKEFEARRGRKINDNELENIINSLGYKDTNNVKLYKQVEKGMAERVGFIRDVVNDFVYYQNQHNGELPNDEEKMKIINKRVGSVIIQQNEDFQTQLSKPYKAKVGDYWNGHIITSTFGKRTAPMQGATTDHKGIDLKYKNNEIFNAYASGTVVLVGKSNTLGNFVDIKDNNGIVHRYGHANSILVKKGDKVTAGQGIGRAGSTGNSTGVHVHYAKLKNGTFLNPLDDTQDTLANNSQNKGWAF